MPSDSNFKKNGIDPKEFQALKEDLEDIQQYLNEFSTFLPLPVVSVNPLGFVLDINHSLEDLVGKSSTSILGTPAEDLFLEKKKFSQLQEKALQGVSMRAEEMTLLSQKGKVPVTVYISPRQDQEKNIIGYFIGLFDITDFKNLQQNLEKRVQERTQSLENSRRALMNILEDVDEAKTEAETERNRTLAIIQEFPEGILFFNASNIVESVNSRVSALFDVSPEQLLGKGLHQLQELPPLESLINFLGSPIKRLEREEFNIGKDVVLEVSTIYIHRGEKKIGTLVVLRDISREKVVEQLKTEFVSLAAHQLRTPLSAIKWTLRMLLDGDLGKISNEQRQFLEKTYKSNERMIRLINDLLNVTRIEEGRFLYNIEKEDLRSIVAECVKTAKPQAERKGLELKTDLASGRLPKVAVDKEKITLAVQNLIDNAISYTKKGEVKVSLSFDKDKQEFLVSVKDTGMGIPKEYQKRLFTKFFRAANAQRTDTEGTGLGLFIAKNIIEAHKGRIWFESEVDKGTTFYFTIPAKQELEEFLRGF